VTGPPRCPVCKTWLTADRTIEESYREESRAGRQARWEYLLACSGCLSVVRQQRSELPGRATARSAASSSVLSVEVAGAMVSRQLERLRGDRVIERIEELRADPLLRIVLRVPEVFAVTRPWYRSVVVLAEPASFLLLAPPGGEKGRVRLNLLWTDTPVEPLTADTAPLTPERLRIRMGARMRVKAADATSFLLEPPPSDEELGWLEGLLTYPDLVRPADPW